MEERRQNKRHTVEVFMAGQWVRVEGGLSEAAADTLCEEIVAEGRSPLTLRIKEESWA